MTDDKHKPKRPKAMRVTTEATKAKLPRPTRKKPARIADGTVTVRERNDAGGYTYSRFDPDSGAYVGRGEPPTRKKPANARLRPDTPTPEKVQCPRCEKWLRVGVHDIHTCYDAKALRAVDINETSGLSVNGFTPTPSPIAGQSLDGIGSQPAPEVRAIPCGEDAQGNTVLFTEAPSKDWWEDIPWTHDTVVLEGYHAPVPPPDTSAYPWPVRWRQALTRPLICVMKATAYRLRLWAWHLEGNP